MIELSLFSGAGGGLLATQHLLGWRCVGYIEWDDYCQKVIRQRIEDGYLHNAPIYGDIRTFIDDGYARAYQLLVDIITAGFPCQPFSVAGKQEGKNDPRNMWPATLECIRIVRPRYCLLENVPGLLSRKHRYFETILKDLAEGGYTARWKVISAAEVGAPHRRDRLWIVAYNTSQGGQPKRRGQSKPGQTSGEPTSSRQDVADSASEGLEKPEAQGQQKLLSHAERGSSEGWFSTDPADGPIESRVGRVVDGCTHRVDRLKALGNMQVPAVVATVWELLGQ